jgi:hypothetical protein
MQLPNSRGEEAVHSFANGQYKDCKDGLDVILLFDGTCFRMERLTGTVTGLQYAPLVQELFHRV